MVPQWHIDRSVQDRTGDIHITPNDDLRPHELTRACWCHPVVEDWDIVAHFALDGREKHERGAPLH